MRILSNLVLLSFLGSRLFGAEAKWILLKSPNFMMYSSASERNSRDALRNFEQVHNFFVQAMGRIPGKAQPVRIVAFGSKKDYEPYRPNAVAIAFYYTTGASEGIVLGDLGAEVFPIAIHEYVHLVVRHAGLKLPPWLDEGMAELFSNIRPMAGKVVLGALIEGRFEALLADKWVPLGTIVAADHNSPYYNEKSRAGSLYNEGWALTHMLELGTAYRPGFPKFLGLVSSGTPTGEALHQVYGKSVEQVDKELRDYLHGNEFKAAIFSQKLEEVKDEIPAEAASPFDVKLVLADLLNRPGKEQETRAAMEQLAAENPKRPEPFAALGYLAWRAKNVDEAVKDFGTAFALGGREPGMLWDYGRLVRPRNAGESIRVLSELLAQQPARKEVRMELAAVQLVSKQPGAALDTLDAVKAVTPEEAPRLFLLLAHAHLDAGQKEEARLSAQNLAKFAKTDEDRSQAAEVLRYLDAMEKGPTTAQGSLPTPPPLGRSLSRVVPLAKSLAGSFVELDCSGTAPKMILETAEGKKVFLIDDAKKVLGDTLDLTCGPQPKVGLRVQFIPADQTGVDGLLRRIQLAP